MKEETIMKMISAIVRSDKVELIARRLKDVGVSDLFQKGSHGRGMQIVERTLRKIRIGRDK